MSIDLPTRATLFGIGREYVLSRAKRIDPSQIDVEGSDVNVFVGSQSVVAASLVRQLAYGLNRMFLDGAEREDLDRWAFDRYTVTRKAASAAVGEVRIFRESNVVGAGSVPVGTKVSTLTGIEYITTTTATFGALDLEAFANVRAVQAGKATQVAETAIRRFPNGGSLFDTSLQVRNDEPTAGGEDAEDDDTFRNRLRQFWRTSRRGVLAAIEFGALTVPGVVSAQAIETVEAIGTMSLPARVVQLYISDSSGVASRALAAQVDTALADYRAGGIAVIISTSMPTLVDVTLRLQFIAGVDTATLSEAVRTAVIDFINSLPVNGALYLSQLYTVLQRFANDGLIVPTGAIVTPIGDLVPTPGTTLRTTAANVRVVS